MNKGDCLKRLYIMAGFVFFVLLFFSFVYSYGLEFMGYSVYEPVQKYVYSELPNYFQLKTGERFVMDIDGEEGYIFSDDSQFFEIDKNEGIIDFIPYQEGKFNVVIITLKDVNDFQYKSIIFEVEE
jgi:hypothetical protein